MSNMTVGSFAIKNGIFSGPLNYMEDRGYLLLDAILEGTDEGYKQIESMSPNTETAILIRMQSDYEIWIGSSEWLRFVPLN